MFDKFVMLMVGYFVVTLIHALARNHHRKRTKSAADWILILSRLNNCFKAKRAVWMEDAVEKNVF